MTRASLLGLVALCMSASALAAEPFGWQMHRVGKYRSEACGVGDFNKDGKLDIMAGAYLYLAPDWKAVKIRELAGEVDEQGKGYMHDFANLPLDVDGDGCLDVVSVMWHEKKSVWYRNPGKVDGGLWQENLIEQNGNFECAELWDINGDGKAHEVLPHVGGTVWYRLTGDKQKPFAIEKICDKRMAFGGGVGDINGDGRPDVVRPDAWFEAPADPVKGQWKEHPLKVGGKEEGKADHTPEILVFDVNKDGLNDLITSSAHKYGIWWFEQTRANGEIGWKRHEIDASWTQAHSLTLADIDGDGDMDLVTGKRFMAHNGNDPEETAPLGVYWYQLKRGPNPVWTKHTISFNQGVGSSLNTVVADMDGDGDLDVVVTGKWGGPVWFENKRK